MRIAQVIKNFDCGGSESYLCDLANGLLALDNEVFVVGGAGRARKRLRKGVHFSEHRMRSPFLIPDVFWFWRYVRKYKIQVIHAHQRYAILVSSWVGFLTRIPVVVTVHGRTCYDLRSRASRRFPSRFVFVSKYVYSNSPNLHEIEARSVLLPNGVTVAPQVQAFDPYRITYVSRIDRKHAEVIRMLLQDVLPALISDYPLLSLQVFGDGSCLEELRSEAEAFNTTAGRNVVCFRGYSPGVSDELKTSSLVVGVGRVALEALACGVPVLPVNRQRAGKLIDRHNFDLYQQNNFVAVTMDPPKPELLRQELCAFFHNPHQWREETGLLQQQVKDLFSQEVIVAKMARLYGSL